MKTLNKTSVLLVEDDVDMRNTISENLKAVDYKVYATRKSIEGCRKNQHPRRQIPSSSG